MKSRYRRRSSRHYRAHRYSNYLWSQDPLIILIIFLGGSTALVTLGSWLWTQWGWQLTGGLLAILAGVFLGAILWPDLRRARWQKKSLRDIDLMDGYDFEHYVTELMRCQGYYRVIRTYDSHDHGADIEAYSNDVLGQSLYTVVQVKRWSAAVDMSAVNDVTRALLYYQADKGMIVTNSYLDSQASQSAQKLGYTVVERDQLIEWMAVYKKWQPWWQRLSNSIFPNI